MNLFLFGAGASAFCGDAACPPLGNKLFDALRARGGHCSRIPSEFHPLFEQSFEIGMGKYIEATDDLVLQAGVVNEMAGYLASFSPGPGNFYRRLLAALRGSGRPFALSTLNYDMLIELSHNGACAYFKEVMEPGDTLLLKIHGSVNFLPAAQIAVRGGSARGTLSLYRGPIRTVSQSEALAFCGPDQGLTPIMAMYEPRKKVLAAPEAVEVLQHQWAEVVQSAGAIFLVGVAVVEHDRHVWDCLAAARAPIYYVNPDSTQYEKWATAAGKQDVVQLCKYFGDSFDRIVERLV